MRAKNILSREGRCYHGTKKFGDWGGETTPGCGGKGGLTWQPCAKGRVFLRLGVCPIGIHFQIFLCETNDIYIIVRAPWVLDGIPDFGDYRVKGRGIWRTWWKEIHPNFHLLPNSSPNFFDILSEITHHFKKRILPTPGEFCQTF